MKNQRGGIIVPYQDSSRQKETFMGYLSNSDINKLSMGAYGLTLFSQLIIEPPDNSDWTLRISDTTNSHFYANTNKNESSWEIPDTLINDVTLLPIKDYYKKMVPGSDYGKPIYNLVMKLCVISETQVITDNILDNQLTSVTKNDFQNEINIQTDIFFKTLEYLQPLTPGIVYAEIIDDIQQIEEILVLIENNGENGIKISVENLLNFIKDNRGVGLGIIVMELISPGKTLFQIESQNKNKRRLIRNIGRYGILQLALQTEYSQNDFHMGNIMIMKDTNYFNNYDYRPFIIDFGRAVKIPPNIMETIRNLVKEDQYIEALQYLCDNSFAYDAVHDIKYAEDYYGWICGDYNMSGVDYNNYIDEAAKDTNTAVTIMKRDIPRPQPLTLCDQILIKKLFSEREKAIDSSIKRMNDLHSQEPDKYPLLPISNQIKNKLYNGMIGGRKQRRKYNRNRLSNKVSYKNRKTVRGKKRANKTRKTHKK